MSGRLTAFNAFLRRVVKPRLAATRSPARAKAEFDRFASLCLRCPPHVRRIVDDGSPAIHWFSAGLCESQRVILHFHGGAYIAGSPRTHEAMLGQLSQLSGCRVAAPAYRLAPVHPAPSQFEDAVAAHAALLAKGYAPEEIILGGDSAGGGLALALLADICTRDLRPAGLYALSPWVDLTLSGESLCTNADADPLLPAERVADTTGLVLGGFPADDPQVSPLFARFEAPPPVSLHVGSTEILRDDSRRMAAHLRECGGSVALHEWNGAPHAWPLFDGFFPEAREALEDVAAFVRSL